MGYKLGETFLFSYPYTAVAHVKGSYDLNTYTTGTKSATSLTADASGAVVAWAFVAIGEFCNVDGAPGFQPANGDALINYFLAPAGAIPTGYRSSGWIDRSPTGINVYHGSVASSLNNFNTSCRVSAADTTYQGFAVSAFDFKCDLTIDYTGLWSTNATAINNCTDDNRYIGVMLDVVGAAFDVDVNIADLNTAIANSQTGNKIRFNAGKLEFSWANFIQAGASKTTVAAVNHAVLATYITDDTQVTYGAAATAKQIIFTFDSPKSSGNNVYMWDPQITVLDGVGGSSSSIAAFFGLTFFSLLLNLM